MCVCVFFFLDDDARKSISIPSESSNSTSIKDEILMKLWEQIHIAKEVEKKKKTKKNK